jgi:hypothetical protein
MTIVNKIAAVTTTGQHSLRGKLALTTAIATLAFSYAGRNAYAGSCTGAGGVYSCSGAANPGVDARQTINGGATPITISTTAGFGFDNSGGFPQGFIESTTNTAGISFTDTNNSTIIAEGKGLYLQNDSGGSGDITVYSNGTIQVTGTGGGSFPAAISARNLAGGNISITANNAEGPNTRYGIDARASGSGNFDITTNGTVSGQTGIQASGASAGNDNITVNGTVSGTYGDGVFTYSGTSGSGGVATIDIASGASVTATRNGINAGLRSSATANITVSGTVAGGTGINAGIAVNRNGGYGTANITLNNGANVSAASGAAIGVNRGFYGTYSSYNQTDATITVNAGAVVTGSIRTAGGSDSVTFDGNDFSTVTTVNLGDGPNTDSLTFRNNSGTFAGGSIVNVETVTIDTGADIVISGPVTTDNLVVSNGGILGGDLQLTGNLNVDTGILKVAAGDVFNVSGTFDIGSGATVGFDFDSFGAGPIDVSAFFTGTQPTFGAGFLNTNFLLITQNAGSVGQQLQFDFGGDSVLLTAVLDGGASESNELPVPSGGLLFAGGLLGMLGLRRRRQAA